MSIRFATPPEASNAEAQRGLSEITSSHRFGLTAEALGGGIDPNSLSSPHPVFLARLDEARTGKALDSAKHYGWRYFVGPGTGRAAEVALGGSQGTYNFSGLNSGAMNNRLLAVLNEAENDPRVKERDFEPSLLQVNALNLSVIWLKATNSQNDLFVPVEPAPKEFHAGQVYERNEFNELLTAAARNKPDIKPDSQTDSAAQERG